VAVRKVATLLRELACHMGSHSVTCHPAEVTFPPLPQPKLVLDLATLDGCKAELRITVTGYITYFVAAVDVGQWVTLSFAENKVS